MEKELSNAIVRLRVIATLIIVAYHCICPYLNFNWGGYLGDLISLNDTLRFVFINVLCYMMLPTFFMISGMLFYHRKQHYADRKVIFWRKFDRLMVPYALVFMLCSFLDFPRIGIASCYGHLWFVQDLFLYFCIALLAYNVRECWLVLFAFGCFILWCMQAHLGITLEGEIGRLMQYGVFFFGGHYAAKYFDWIRQYNWFKWGVSVVWIIALILHKQTISMLLFNVVLLAMVPTCPIESKVMLYLDKQSYRIYLLHHVVLFGLFVIPCFQSLYTHSAIGATLLMFVSVIVLTIGMCQCLTKLNFKYF